MPHQNSLDPVWRFNIAQILVAWFLSDAPLGSSLGPHLHLFLLRKEWQNSMFSDCAGISTGSDRAEICTIADSHIIERRWSLVAYQQQLPDTLRRNHKNRDCKKSIRRWRDTSNYQSTDPNDPVDRATSVQQRNTTKTARITTATTPIH